MLFEEQQKFNQWWVWLLLVGVSLIPAYGIVQQVILGQPFGDKPASDLLLILMFLLTVILMLGFYAVTLRTTVTSDYVEIRFAPFFTKRWTWDEVKTAQIVDYGFVGYGVRVGTKYGTVYNVRGREGLYLGLKSGKKVCIGTQQADQLRTVIGDHFTRVRS